MFVSFAKRSGWLLGALLVLIGNLVALPSQEAPISLVTQDGWHLAATYLPSLESKKTVILLHDLGKSQKEFSTFKIALRKEGFGILALDLRGHGNSNKEGTYSKFSKEGVDNEFNKMEYDVSAAIEYLQRKNVPMENLVLMGTGLGANVVAKSTRLWPDIPMIALISPTANVRDVLTIPAIRLYKGQILIAAAAADKKMFLEASVIRNVAYLNSEKFERDVTFLTAYDLTSHELLDKYLTPSVIQWLKTPQKPTALPDIEWAPESEKSEDTKQGEVDVAPSTTEEALVPSVL